MQCLRLGAFTAEGIGSNPGQETLTPQITKSSLKNSLIKFFLKNRGKKQPWLSAWDITQVLNKWWYDYFPHIMEKKAEDSCNYFTDNHRAHESNSDSRACLQVSNHKEGCHWGETKGELENIDSAHGIKGWQKTYFLRQGLGWTISEVPLSCKILRLFLIGRREDKPHLPIFSSGFWEPQWSTWFQPIQALRDGG